MNEAARRRPLPEEVADRILDVAAGRVPRHVVNRAAIDSPRFRAKLRRIAAQTGR